jgi:2-hydroxychromene-2-carboxylate isomerase
MPTADWYFDFISPYAYLQAARLGNLAERVHVRARPVLFAGLLNHHGQLGPAEIAPKRQFVFRQALWLARRDGIAMQLPPSHPFNPLPPLRLAIALDCKVDAITTIFDFIWRDGRDPDDPGEWQQLTEALGVVDAAQALSDPQVKQTLRENTEQAIADGVFGVPTLVIDDELFWGYDATWFALDYLADPAALRREVFDPVDGFAQSAIQRKPQQRASGK